MRRFYIIANYDKEYVREAEMFNIALEQTNLFVERNIRNLYQNRYYLIFE